jgi:hypothetical protein
MRNSAALMSLLAIVAPGQDLEPAPNERWGVLEDGFSVKSRVELLGVGGSSQRSGLKTPASGPQ